MKYVTQHYHTGKQMAKMMKLKHTHMHAPKKKRIYKKRNQNKTYACLICRKIGFILLFFFNGLNFDSPIVFRSVCVFFFIFSGSGFLWHRFVFPIVFFLLDWNKSSGDDDVLWIFRKKWRNLSHSLRSLFGANISLFVYAMPALVLDTQVIHQQQISRCGTKCFTSSTCEPFENVLLPFFRLGIL